MSGSTEGLEKHIHWKELQSGSESVSMRRDFHKMRNQELREHDRTKKEKQSAYTQSDRDIELPALRHFTFVIVICLAVIPESI